MEILHFITILSRVLLMLLFCVPTDLKAQYTHGDTREEFFWLNQAYEKNKRPPGEGPTEIYVELFVNNLGPVIEDLMSYKVDIFLRQRWNDQRLVNASAFGYVTHIKLPWQYQGRFWVPDTYFMNSIHAKHHDVTMTNGLLILEKDGNVTHSIRVTVEATCHMELTYFPMDIQYCPFQIESFLYNSHELVYLPYGPTPVEIRSDIKLPHFTLTNDINVISQNVSYFSANYNRLTTMFVLQRNMSFYIMDSFFPAVLIVILSWIQFCVHRSSIPARAALAVTSVLTMITLTVSTNSKSARLSKIKAMDIFFTICFTYVFAALLEFGIVCYFDKPRYKQRLPIRNKVTRGDTRSSLNKELTDPLTGNAQEENHITKDDFGGKMFEDQNNQHLPLASDKKRGVEVGEEDGMSCYVPVSKMDIYARIYFPLTFVLVNVLFWGYYLIDENSSISFYHRGVKTHGA